MTDKEILDSLNRQFFFAGFMEQDRQNRLISAMGVGYNIYRSIWYINDHPEGVLGAEAAAGAVFLARTTKDKEAVRSFITGRIGYDLSRTCDEIRPGYRFDVSCRGTVPEAVTAFLEGTDFEDVLRTAVSLGGDCDTLTCIACSIAEAFYGIPEDLKEGCRARLTDEMIGIAEEVDLHLA